MKAGNVFAFCVHEETSLNAPQVSLAWRYMVTVKGICAEIESWSRDTVYHTVSMHTPGTATTKPTCLVSRCIQRMYTAWGRSYVSRVPSIDFRKELVG